jgi:hypothetical protein
MDLEATIRASGPPDLIGGGLPVAEQIASVRERIAQNPGNPGPRNKLASLLQADGRADEAASVLRDTIDCFPKNTKAREQLRALLERPLERPKAEPVERPIAGPVKHPAVEAFEHPAAEPAPFPYIGLLPALEIPPAIEALPAERATLPVAGGWSLVQEPRHMPIRLSRLRPGAEWMAGGAILLVLGVVWQVWRLLPESHLLQKPAAIVMQEAIPVLASVVAESLRPPLPVSVQAEAPATPSPQPVTVAETRLPPLPEGMPQRVVILRARHDPASSRAALRMETRLEAQHVAVSASMAVAGAGSPGIGYFYMEDLPEAEALSRRMPDIVGKLRLISGAARVAQQPGAIAIVMP